MKSVLMVSYWYPSAIGAAAQRVAGFARHLAEFGWRPCVVTAGEPSGNDGTELLRVRDVGGRAMAVFPDYVWPEQSAGHGWRPHGWVFPDRFLIWRRRAYRAAMQSIRNPQSAIRNSSVVWATFPPASAAALGADLAKELGVPLVLDFRDLWFGPGGYEPPTRVHRWLHERLERRVARAASRLVVVSDAMGDYLSQRYGVPRERVHTIPNGFELDDLAAPEEPLPRGRGSEIVVSHVGTVIARNRPELFFQAVAGSPRVEQWRRDGLRIRFVGNLSRATAARPEFGGLIATTGMVSAAEARREMREADALLLLVGDYVGRWGHNAKLFDYLAAGRLILCLEEKPGSNDRRLLESLAPDRCVFAALADQTAVVAGVDAVCEMARRLGRRPLPMPEGLARYSRRALTRELATVLDEIGRAAQDRTLRTNAS